MKNQNIVWALILLGVFVSCEQNKNNMDQPQEKFSLEYEKFTLDNGLEVILHVDKSDPIVAVATMMHVGSNREKPGRTGFAHFFEHMSFNDSENVPVGANRKIIPEWGGSRNGGTWSDGTVYYEVVPKDAFEKILWIDSDRLGFMINTVTKEALEREKQVVKNEKRQRVDNNPYGYTDEIIRKNLYPEDHPYSWTVIGSLPDLQAATLDDVKEFYEHYYGAANATLVIAGDIDVEETKDLVKQWFGEIRKGPEVEPLQPMHVTLEADKSLYFKDNFAKLPELRMVYPTVEEYNDDAIPLQILGELLSGSRKSPLYQVLVEEQKLAPNVGTYQSSNELAGEFIFRVRANADTNLNEVKSAIDEGLERFENNSFSDEELVRIKTEAETSLYYGVETVLNKAFQLAQDNEFKGDPGFVTTRAQLLQDVTREDIMRVYNTYIKNKPAIKLSTIPKDQEDLRLANSEEASVWIEEVTAMSAAEQVGQGEEAEYEITQTKNDRSEPDFREAPLFKMPQIYQDKLSNGMQVLGTVSDEVPLVTFRITIDGGHLLDPDDKAGVAAYTADMLNQGTATKTPAELEQAIGLLGASINFSSSTEEFVISGSCLSRNFDQTLALVKEMLMQPRWDETEFDRLKRALETSLKGREANPTAIASINFNKLIYGAESMYGMPNSGTLESTENITMTDLKAYYNNLTPANATFHIVGAIGKDQVINSLEVLNDWQGDAITVGDFKMPENTKAGNLYFIDVPGSKQSVIYVGKEALAATDSKASDLDFANEILGGGSSGRLFQTLRIEKGYTYGAYSYVRPSIAVAPFTITTSVRANATLPSLKIIQEMIQDYGPGFTTTDVELTQNKVIKQNTRAYESLNAKLGILRAVSKYDKEVNYLENEQDRLMNMQLDDFKEVIDTYLQEEEMVYLVVGDKATQFDELKQLDKNVIELDINGNKI